VRLRVSDVATGRLCACLKMAARTSTHDVATEAYLRMLAHGGAEARSGHVSQAAAEPPWAATWKLTNDIIVQVRSLEAQGVKVEGW
jgi:hypothetical protein